MKHVPFYPNSNDSLHCLQATLMSVFDFFEADFNLRLEDLEALTGFVPGKLTWPMRAYLGAADRGYEVLVFDPMDFHRFGKEPIEYLTELVGEEATKLYIEQSDITGAIKDTKELLARGNIILKTKTPTIDDLKQLLSDGYLCICHVDQNVLTSEPGQGDHFILVYDIDGDFITAHNPGPPPTEGQRLTIEKFCLAWGSPSEYAKSVLALKR